MQLLAVYWTGSRGSWLLGVPYGLLVFLHLPLIAEAASKLERAPPRFQGHSGDSRPAPRAGCPGSRSPARVPGPDRFSRTLRQHSRANGRLLVGAVHPDRGPDSNVISEVLGRSRQFRQDDAAPGPGAAGAHSGASPHPIAHGKPGAGAEKRSGD